LRVDIEIHSIGSALGAVHGNPGRYHVASIRDTRTADCLIDRHEHSCRSLLRLQFDDAWTQLHAGWGQTLPSSAQVQAALDWARPRLDEPILVHCVAGISRSSAIACLIARCAGDDTEAASILDASRHWPNPRIVQIGVRLLAAPDLPAAISERIPNWPVAGDGHG
jgi:predicted protein tyrosine phosphatase